MNEPEKRRSYNSEKKIQVILSTPGKNLKLKLFFLIVGLGYHCSTLNLTL